MLGASLEQQPDQLDGRDANNPKTKKVAIQFRIRIKCRKKRRDGETEPEEREVGPVVVEEFSRSTPGGMEVQPLLMIEADSDDTSSPMSRMPPEEISPSDAVEWPQQDNEPNDVPSPISSPWAPPSSPVAQAEPIASTPSESGSGQQTRRPEETGQKEPTDWACDIDDPTAVCQIRFKWDPCEYPPGENWENVKPTKIPKLRKCCMCCPRRTHRPQVSVEKSEPTYEVTTIGEPQPQPRSMPSSGSNGSERAVKTRHPEGMTVQCPDCSEEFDVFVENTRMEWQRT